MIGEAEAAESLGVRPFAMRRRGSASLFGHEINARCPAHVADNNSLVVRSGARASQDD